VLLVAHPGELVGYKAGTKVLDETHEAVALRVGLREGRTGWPIGEIDVRRDQGDGGTIARQVIESEHELDRGHTAAGDENFKRSAAVAGSRLAVDHRFC